MDIITTIGMTIITVITITTIGGATMIITGILRIGTTQNPLSHGNRQIITDEFLQMAWLQTDQTATRVGI